MTTRNRRGQVERDLEQAAIDTEAAELRAQRYTFPEIAAHQGCSVSTAWERVKRAIAAVPYEAVEDLRRIELESLDELEGRVREVLLATHLKVDHGKLIEIDGVAMIDDGPVVTAAMAILRIKDMRAKLTGEYAPIKVDGDVKHSVQSDLDREIAGLLAEVAGLGQGSPEMAPSGTPNTGHA